MAHFVTIVVEVMIPPLVGVATFTLLRLLGRRRERDATSLRSPEIIS
jgi:hypothetical protein